MVGDPEKVLILKAEFTFKGLGHFYLKKQLTESSDRGVFHFSVDMPVGEWKDSGDSVLLTTEFVGGGSAVAGEVSGAVERAVVEVDTELILYVGVPLREGKVCL